MAASAIGYARCERRAAIAAGPSGSSSIGLDPLYLSAAS